MDSNPFRSAQSFLNSHPFAKWGSFVASIGASICFVLLFPILYLFVDLLVTQGRMPSYASQTPSQKKTFREEWDRTLGKNDSIATNLGRIRPTELSGDAEWEARWQASVYTTLEAKVNKDAAETYLPLESTEGRGGTSKQLGVLATFARERGRWTGSVLGWLASWNAWMWRPGENGSANVTYLTGLFIIGFVLALLRGFFLNAAAHGSAVATIEAAVRMRRALYTHGFRLSALAVRPDAQEEAGDLITRRIEQIHDGLTAWLTAGVRAPVLTVLLLIVLFAVHFWLTLCLLLLAAMVWLVAGQAATWFRRDARHAERRVEARLAQMRESMSLLQLVKAYLMERFSQTRFERQLTDLTRLTWRRLRGEAFSRPALFTVISLAGVAMLYLAGRVVLSGEMSVAGLAVTGTAVATLVGAVNRWIAARVRIAKGRAAAADVFEFLDRRGEAGQAIDAEFLQPMSKKLELVGVSLRELGTGRMILEDVSLSIPAGTKAAIVCSNLDESHALAHLITRFADPTAGEVRVDGKNTRWVTYESVRTQVALVLENGLTFADTVANNIGCGEPTYTLPQIIEAAKTAHAHQFIQKLPYGYETLIGDGGVSLRPGQRYRLALARAILRDPSLLVIEEPTQPLDADSWVLIDDAISRIRQGRTLFFLARRPVTAKSAERVFVIHNGRLVASGNHDELVNGSDLYRLLHFKQTLAATG